jgi:hypothetical protein
MLEFFLKQNFINKLEITFSEEVIHEATLSFFLQKTQIQFFRTQNFLTPQSAKPALSQPI